MRHRVAVVLVMGALLATDAGAQVAIKGAADGLASPTRSIALDVPPLSNNAAADDKLRADQGVRFDGAVFMDGQNCANPFGALDLSCTVPGIGRSAISNGNAASPLAPPSVSILFDNPITGIAFNLFALDFMSEDGQRLVSDTRFVLLDGAGKDIDANNDGTADFSFSAVPQDPIGFDFDSGLKWWGFEGGEFGGIRIVAPLTLEAPKDIVFAFWLTSIEISEPAPVDVVPEPSTIALVAAGVVGLAAARRRRR